jgi:starvation-inducible DNA-binding protein
MSKPNKLKKDVREKMESQRVAISTMPSDLGADASKDIAGAMNSILADVFTLYLKTKNFHWHLTGPHFRDYHLLLDEQADQLFAMTDVIAERVRKVGGRTVTSIGQIARLSRIEDNDADYVEASDMLAELRSDNAALAASLREAHEVCDEHRDVATTSLIENWIDETERRAWFLFESGVRSDATGH